jgi:hypothetical protein
VAQVVDEAPHVEVEQVGVEVVAAAGVDDRLDAGITCGLADVSAQVAGFGGQALAGAADGCGGPKRFHDVGQLGAGSVDGQVDEQFAGVVAQSGNRTSVLVEDGRFTEQPHFHRTDRLLRRRAVGRRRFFAL